MSQVPSNDATVNGGGTITAGTYGTVTINGGGTVTGDIVCTALRVNGAGTFQGTVKAASISVNGSGTFNQSVQVAEMSVNGDGSVRGGLGVTRLSVRGNLNVDGGIAAIDIDLRGFVRTPGDVATDVLRGEGAIEAGNITAKTVDLGVYGPSRVRQIEADKVTLRAPKSFAEVFMFFTNKEFTAESIRASEVWLENTAANVVSAGNVTVGSNARVGLVQYSETYATRDNAAVTEARQVTGG